jgi:hypothetical protein
MYYELKDGEKLILADWQTANDLARRWTYVLWKAIEREWVGDGDEIPQPEPLPPPPLPGNQFTEDEAEFLKDFIAGYNEEGEEESDD